MPYYDNHLNGNELELFALNRIDNQEGAGVEEHLLLCEACRDALEQVERDIRVLLICLRESEPCPSLQ